VEKSHFGYVKSRFVELTVSSKKFKTIFGVLVIFMVALVTGVTVGKLYVDSIPDNIIMGMTEAELRDSDAVVKKLVEKSKSSKPDSFSAVELYQVAEYNFNQKENFYKTSNGYAINAVDKQTLRSFNLLRDGEYIFDNVSPGIVNVITRVRHTKGSDLVTRNTNGSFANSSKDKGVWDTKDDEKYTVKEFEGKFNRHPLSNITYVISSKTCPKDAATKVSKTADGNYSFKINLKGSYLTAAAIHYSYEIFYTSYGMLSSEAKKNTILPAWKEMEMTVVVNENFDFVSINYDEKYSVNTKFGYQTVNDVFRENFYFDLDQMPSLEEVL